MSLIINLNERHIQKQNAQKLIWRNRYGIAKRERMMVFN